MKRRKFIKNSAIFAFGMGVTGNIHWEDGSFKGDAPTTTDILGPFYRPGAPARKILYPPGFKGEILHLSGTIFNEDGIQPVSNALIEVWQCNEDGLYDNISDDFVFRGSQRLGPGGKYYFITAIPVPYATEDFPDQFRPAHVHMRISVDGQQDLITQIYFKGDPNLETDPSTKSSLSVNRILSVKKIKNNESEIKFDIVLKKEYVPGANVFHKVCGIYKMNDKSTMEFYREGDFLFYKSNNQIKGALSYSGNNIFVGGVNDTEAKFDIQAKGNATVQFRFMRRKETNLQGKKILDYRGP